MIGALNSGCRDLRPMESRSSSSDFGGPAAGKSNPGSSSSGALPASREAHPDERSHVCMPLERRRGFAGADRWGRSLDLPVAGPAAAQIRRSEVPMPER